MQISSSKPSNTELVLNVTLDLSEITKSKETVLKRLKHEVKIPGFREGKAPLDLVEKNVDQKTLQTYFLEEAITEAYTEAARKEGARPVDRPDIQLTKFVPFTELTFTAKVPVIGKIKLADYKKIKKTKPTVKITDKDVEEVITSLKTRMAEKKDVSRASKDGDQVWIDFKGVDAKGEPVKGADGKDYPLILGSNTFIPGFETNLVGVKAGEEKTFTLTFPKDYGVKALANKKVTFTVNVTKVQEVVEPKLDDEFAKKVGPFESLEQLKTDIRKQLEHERQHEANRDFESELIKEISDKSTIEIPEILITDQIERIVQELQQNIMYRGQTWQEYLEAEGKSEEEYRKDVVKPQAQNRVKAGLVLAEIAEQENIEVTPEELAVRIQSLKGQYQDNQMQSELDKPENRRDIASRIITEKTIARVVEYSK